MGNLKRKACVALFVLISLTSNQVSGQQSNERISLQQLLNSMQTNYDLIKYQISLVQARQAEKKAVIYNR